MTSARAVVIVFAGIFLAASIGRPHVDGDLYWQQWLGERILQTHAIPHQLGSEAFAAVGAPWTPQEWSFSLVVALLYGAHLPQLSWLLVAVAAIGALWLVSVRVERSGATPIAALVALVLCAYAMTPSFGVRVQVFGWVALAGLLCVLDAQRGVWWKAGLITMAWSNLHASVVLAPAVAAIDAVATLIARRRFDAETRMRILLVPLLTFASCANPFGVGLLRYAFDLARSPIRSQIVEWHRLGAGDANLIVTLSVLVGAALFAGAVLREHPREVLRVTLFGIAGTLAVRNIPLAAIVVAPLAALGFTRIERRLHTATFAAPANTRVLTTIALSAAVLMGCFTFVSLRRSDTANLPYAAMEELAAIPGEHRVFCADFAWCSLALSHANLRVFLDGRADPFPLAVWRDFDRIRRMAPGWDATLATRRIDAVVVATGTPLDRALRHRTIWRQSYADPQFHTYIITKPY